MNQNSRTVAATVVGAVIGGMAGYMFFTEKGRALRRQIEPALEDMMRELQEIRATITKASTVAGDGWKLLNEALHEGGVAPPVESAPVYTRTGQAHPF